MTGGSWRLTAGVTARGQGGRPRTRTAVQTLGFGTESGQMTVLADLAPVVEPGATLTLNLFDGSVPDVLGAPAVLANLRSFAVWVESGGDAGGVTIAPGASNGNSLWFGGTSPTKTIYPAGPPELAGSAAGVAVDAARATVQFTNNGAVPAAVRIALAGLDPMGVTYFPGSNLLSLIG